MYIIVGLGVGRSGVGGGVGGLGVGWGAGSDGSDQESENENLYVANNYTLRNVSLLNICSQDQIFVFDSLESYLHVETGGFQLKLCSVGAERLSYIVVQATRNRMT